MNIPLSAKLRNYRATTFYSFLGLFFLLCIIACCHTHKPLHNVTATVDASIEYQTIDGWGITHYIVWNWEGPDRYPIPEQDVMKQIKNDLRIDYIRNYWLVFTYEQENDDSDPYHFNWDYYNSQFNPYAYVFQRLRDQQNANLQYELVVADTKPAWMCDENGRFDSSIPHVYEELAEFFAAILIYARNNYGLNIPYIAIEGEPSYKMQRKGATGFTPIQLKHAITVIGARLRKEGLTTKIVAPDDFTAASTKTMCLTILPDTLATRYMASIAYHAYDSKSGVNGPDVTISAMKDLADSDVVKTSGLPLWLTEWAFSHAYGDRMRDHVDELRFALDFVKMVYNAHVYANTSLYVIWSTTYDWGYDADNNGKIENEGIFGPGFTDGRLSLKKYGHALGQYTKYIRPGSKRISARLDGASNVFITAYKDMKNGIFTMVCINRNRYKLDLTVTVDGIPGLTSLKIMRTSQTEDGVEVGTISMIENIFAVHLPDSSVTTFLGHFTTH